MSCEREGEELRAGEGEGDRKGGCEGGLRLEAGKGEKGIGMKSE